MTAFKHHAQGDVGIEGVDFDDGAFVPISADYNVPATNAKVPIAVMPRAMRVRSIIVRPTVAGTDAGAVTVAVRKVPSGTALGSGTLLHSGTGNLKGTINVNQTLALTPDNCNIAAGEALALDFTGVGTAAVGAVTIMLSPR
jgi:hypothetical protein